LALAIYANHSKIDERIDFIVEVLGGNNMESGALGRNWTLNWESRAACQKLQNDLGGSIIAWLG
jgi:hypothetical protein